MATPNSSRKKSKITISDNMSILKKKRKRSLKRFMCVA